MLCWIDGTAMQPTRTLNWYCKRTTIQPTGGAGMEDVLLLNGREQFVRQKGERHQTLPISCGAESVAGCVSQRACVYCGARVVLNPVADALHLVHGPIGCASYTWDIRGSLNSGDALYREGFSTDLREKDIIFGGEKKLAAALDELIVKYRPPVVFVYSTCVVGIIGDDLDAVCKAAAETYDIPVLPVQSSGFVGSKSIGYQTACDVLFKLIEPPTTKLLLRRRPVINYLGDFNLAGEAWILRSYLKKMGVEVNVVFTGDSRYAEIRRAANADLNIIQCAGSMFYLAQKLEDAYQIPFLQVSFLGVEDTAESLRKIARFFAEPEITKRTEEVIAAELHRVMPEITQYRSALSGKKAAVYVGGGFKAISLIRQFREIGMEVVMVGTQTGRREDYAVINDIACDGTIILDDANPAELEKFMLTQGADLLVGGVKERPLAYKLGIAFVDHNHDRKHPLAGFAGAVNFAREVYTTVCSPVWNAVREGGVRGDL